VSRLARLVHVFDCEIGYDRRSLSHSSSLLGLGWSSHCVALQRMTAPLATALLRGVYQIIQTDAQRRDSRLFVLASTFRSAMAGTPTPQNQHALRHQRCCAYFVESDRAIPFARVAVGASPYKNGRSDYAENEDHQ
jgi:hypothetical protein